MSQRYYISLVSLETHTDMICTKFELRTYLLDITEFYTGRVGLQKFSVSVGRVGSGLVSTKSINIQFARKKGKRAYSSS